MVIVGVGAAGPGSGRTTRDSPCVPVRVLASCKKVAVESFWHAPPPIHKCVCVCVYCRTASYVLGSRIP